MRRSSWRGEDGGGCKRHGVGYGGWSGRGEKKSKTYNNFASTGVCCNSGHCGVVVVVCSLIVVGVIP